MTAIRIAGLTKVYRTTRALDGIDLDVDEGQVFGFLGPNGAGKTTTLRILLGLARPTSGHVEVLGHDVATAAATVRSQVGFLPDVPGFYPWQKAPEFLRLIGSFHGLSGTVLDERVEVLLDLAGLTDVPTPVTAFSRGMKQRLGIAQALINAPRILFLDEPTSALDPLGRKEVLDTIAALNGRTTVFFSTHILGDVERVCTDVAILAKGRVVAEAPIADLKRQYGGSNRFLIDGPDRPALWEVLSREPWLTGMDATDAGIVVSATAAEAPQRRIPGLFAERGWPLVRFEPQDVTLEDVFVDLVGDAR